MVSRTTTSPPPTQVTHSNATTRRTRTTMDQRMRGESPVRAARGAAHSRRAQTGREFSPRPDGCQRTAAVRAAAFALAAALASAEAIVPAGAVHASVAASPARGDARAAARAVGERLAAVRGLTARFTQTLDAASLPGPQIEEGTLYLLRPGRMRWEYSRPA